MRIIKVLAQRISTKAFFEEVMAFWRSWIVGEVGVKLEDYVEDRALSIGSIEHLGESMRLCMHFRPHIS